VSLRICRQRRSTLLTCCQVPFLVGKTASFGFSLVFPCRRRSTATAKSGSTTVLTLASDFGLVFR